MTTRTILPHNHSVSIIPLTGSAPAPTDLIPYNRHGVVIQIERPTPAPLPASLEPRPIIWRIAGQPRLLEVAGEE